MTQKHIRVIVEITMQKEIAESAILSLPGDIKQIFYLNENKAINRIIIKEWARSTKELNDYVERRQRIAK